MSTFLLIILIILDILWITVNWFERILDAMENAPYTEGSLCVFEWLFLAFGIWWLTL